MNWKARALVSRELDENQLASLVARGKPVNYNDALGLIGMLLRARGDVVEGVKPVPPPAPGDDKKKDLSPKAEDLSLDDLVSSDDNETPWSTVLERMKNDDRLEMAVQDGLVYPVPKQA